MAITVFDDSIFNNATDVTSFAEASYAHVGTLMLVFLQWRETVTSDGGISFDTMTFNGLDLAQVASVISGGVHSEIWALATSKLNVVGDINGTWGGDTATGRASAVWHVLSLNGTAEDLPGAIHNATTGTGSSTTPTLAVTTDFATSFAVDCLGLNNSSLGDVTITPGDTEVGGPLGVAGATLRLQSDAQRQTASVGTTTMNYSLSASRAWGMCGCEVLAATTCDLIADQGMVPIER